jgi:murein tripeptide amidase MpaA
MREPNAERDWLLQNYTFRIFPMVNVDGVLLGNFRCDLSGMDMNRNWKNPNKLLHPHLIGIKDEIKRLSL